MASTSPDTSQKPSLWGRFLAILAAMEEGPAERQAREFEARLDAIRQSRSED